MDCPHCSETVGIKAAYADTLIAYDFYKEMQKSIAKDHPEVGKLSRAEFLSRVGYVDI